MEPNPLTYLFAAYAAVWIILAVFLYSIHARENKLHEEIDNLKRTLERS